ncbi:MAG: DUF4298 domain-containing protein [Bacteroidales bacterium]|nr:DUF4298 domain-containing protein [Bacteroidales bacterium]MBP5758895.1 DUF4298 domain-containing protein [Bacteroidales bacterium]
MNIDRITEMEGRLERLKVAVEQLNSALDAFAEAKEDYAVLDTYLGSAGWHRDRADDEAGLLPTDLKRGVLSEDAIWNALEDYRELEARLKGE